MIFCRQVSVKTGSHGMSNLSTILILMLSLIQTDVKFELDHDLALKHISHLALKNVRYSASRLFNAIPVLGHVSIFFS